MATPKLTILLSGMIAGVPHQGGATWAVLQYLLGFKRLGHNVHFVEPVEEAALRPAGGPLARSENAAYFQRVMADFGMGQTSALLLAGQSGRWVYLTRGCVRLRAAPTCLSTSLACWQTRR